MLCMVDLHFCEFCKMPGWHRRREKFARIIANLFSYIEK